MTTQPQRSTDRANIISDEDTRRFILEIVEDANGAVSDEELKNAYGELIELAISAAMYAMWQDRTLTFGWNPASRDLTLTLTDGNKPGTGAQ